MNNPKRFVVTGATGFLGSHVVKSLVDEGHSVGAIVRPSSQVEALRGLPNVHIFETKYAASSFTSIGSIDAVIHVATCYGRNNEAVSDILEANVAFPLKILEQAAAEKVRLFINSDTFFSRPGRLSNYLKPYSLTKRHFLELGRECAKRRGLHFVNLRFEHLYGEGDDPAKLVMSLIDKCVRGEREIQLTTGRQQRDFIHVDDAVAAIMTILGCESDLPDFSEYEVGSGKSSTIRELCLLVNRLSGDRSRLVFGALPYLEGELMISRADVKPLKRLGWNPAVKLEIGLSRLIERQRKLVP